jgi:hypothetical protein
MPQKPLRSPWEAGFPPVAIHAPRSEVSTHPWFEGARSGDVDAAALLVADTCSGPLVDWLAELGKGSAPLLASVHPQKANGLNVLPEVLAHGLHLLLGWETDTELVQANVVDHVGDVGFSHLARQAVFAGAVEPGRAYVLVDDFIGQGGTLANLRGHIMAGGGRVLGATVLTGNTSSSVLRLEPERLQQLRDQHGSIEQWWQQHFGFGFDCLTHAEAGFLLGHDDSAAVRRWIEQCGNPPAVEPAVGGA